MASTTYDPALRLYVADVPWFYFKRADGKVFVSRHTTAVSMNMNTDFLPINCGWSAFPSAYLPGTSNMEINVTFADYDRDLVAAMYAKEYEEATDITDFVNEFLAYNATDNTITLTRTPEIETVYVRGLTNAGTLEEDGTVEAGTFKVQKDGDVYKVKFAAGANNGEDSIEVTYTVKVAGRQMDSDNSKVACGTVILKYPMYSDGKNCTDAEIKKYGLKIIDQARVTTPPSFDWSLTYRFLLG